MERLKIFVLNRLSQGDGIYTTYSDVQSVMNFLHRTGRPQNFSIVATKGKRSLYLERLDAATLAKDLNNFAIQTPWLKSLHGWVNTRSLHSFWPTFSFNRWFTLRVTSLTPFVVTPALWRIKVIDCKIWMRYSQIHISLLSFWWPLAFSQSFGCLVVSFHICVGRRGK